MIEYEKGKKYVPTLKYFLQVKPQTDLVTGKREVKVKNNERIHYF